MVFNKYYDRALLLMLLADKDNNEMIINFLKFMPEEMHEYIRKMISLNSHIATYNHFKVVNFDNKQILHNDGFIYILECALIHGMLNIKLNRNYIDSDIDEQIELSLQPLRRSDLDKNINIGSFRYSLNTIELFKKKMVCSKEYNIKRISFDNVIVSWNFKNIGKMVNINSCFEEITLESLFSDNRFNKSGKKKILNNKGKGYR